MAKNIKIVPNPSGGNPYILFENDNGDKIAMVVATDGSISFSGATSGDELVKFDSDTLNLRVKGNIRFEDQFVFDGASGNVTSTIDTDQKWKGSPEKGLKGLKGAGGQKGDAQVKGEKGEIGSTGNNGGKGPTGDLHKGIKGDKGLLGDQGDGNDKGQKGPIGTQGISPIGPKVI